VADPRLPPGGFFESWETDAAHAHAQPVTAPPIPSRQAPYRPTATLSRWVVVLAAAEVCVSVLDIVYSAVALRIYTAVQSGTGITPGIVTVLDNNELLFTGLAMLTILAGLVLFLAWFAKLYGNLAPLGQASRQRYRTGWAVGGWFVPFLNLVRPKNIADDIWAASEPDPELARERQQPRSILLGWWWAAWLLSGVVGRGVFSSFRSADDVDGLITSYRVAMVSASLDLVAGALTIAVVLAMSRRQQQHALRLARDGMLPPAFRHPGHV
jgi:hypothetical protein